jgi:hypothetical protein
VAITLKGCVNWQHFFGENVSNSKRLFALATLGDPTKNRKDPTCVAPHKAAKGK